MKKIISLDGKWDVTGYGLNGETLTLKADVPGMIHVDLEREGIIPPMFWRDNAEKCQWVEHWTWEYSRSFYIDEAHSLEDSVFAFDGLDTYASISVNGIHLASTKNAHVPFEFDASSVLRIGYNTIRITFTPFHRHLWGVRTDYPMAFTNDRATVRRMQCTFYWDWVGRFVSFGPWRSVSLNFYDKARISDVFISTYDIAPTSAALLFRLETERFPSINGKYPTAFIAVSAPDGKTVWRRSMRVYKSRLDLKMDIAQPLLWWPKHYGDQPLYSYTVELFDEDGNMLDSRNGRFGIRTIRIEQLQDQEGSIEAVITNRILSYNSTRPINEKNVPGSGFTVLVNGVRILCKGSNWVPADPFPCRVTRERYKTLLDLVIKGNQNVLRIWGGGIYENDCFYELCDELGILVNQDFMLACGKYPEDNAEWMESFEDEVKKAIRRIRNHPSLAWYSGDNENVSAFDYDDPASFGIKITDTIYEPALMELDPYRPFFPSCPWGGHTNECEVTGDCHISHYPIFAKPSPVLPRDKYRHFARYASESFTMGSPLFSSIKTFLTEEDMADPDRTILEYHLKNNPTNGDGKTILERSRIASDWAFGEPKSITERVLHDAYQQYYWAHEAVSALRRQRWYYSGIQFWMLNDCWPSAGWSLIDYDLVPKSGWYGARQASAPVAVSITEEGDEYYIWILNDSIRDANGKVAVSLISFGGERQEIACADFESVHNCAQTVMKIKKSDMPAPLDNSNQLMAEISGDLEPMRTFFFHSWPKHMELPKAEYTCVFNKDSSEMTITSRTYLRAVSIDICGVCSDNYFDMLPGETRVIHVDCYGDTTVEDAKIYCLNDQGNA